MSKKHVPYFRFYPSDFMAGVRGMTAQEVGVYTMLLCLIYEASGPVENNPLRLATYCGMRLPTFERTCEKLVALGKITEANGHLSNARAEAEIAKRADDLEIAFRAGKASAEKRQQKQADASTPVQRSLNHTDTDTDTVKKESVFSDEKTLLRVLRFAEFWQAYPHRDGKRGRKLAEAKYRAAVKRGIAEQTIIDGAKRAHSDPRVKAGFARDPTTWINQAGWDDEIAPTVTAFRGGYTPEEQQTRQAAFEAMVAKARTQ